MNYENYKVTVPEGSKGIWKVEKFSITKKDTTRSIFSYGVRSPEPGDYTRLIRKGAWNPIMSDTSAEIWDLYPLFSNACGYILINGLGLGVAVQGCLDKNSVRHVTVIEISQDLIDLVGSYYLKRYGDRLTIVCSDAFEYKPLKNIRYNAVWHDIWDNICSDNLPEMHKLHRKYGRRTDWQGSWCREECT